MNNDEFNELFELELMADEPFKPAIIKMKPEPTLVVSDFAEREIANNVRSEDKKFRMTAKGWFLTYPKCTLAKEEAQKILMDKRPDVYRCVVGRELHQDGTPHLHAYLELASRYTCTNSKYWDLKEFHGNYQTAKSFYAVAKYVIKGKDYVEFGMNAKQEVEARSSKKAILGKELVEGAELVEVVETNPALIFEYDRLSRSLAAFKRDKALLSKKRQPFDLDGFEKKRHIWLHGDSNTGKTTVLRRILNHKGYNTDVDQTFQIPLNNDWIGYENQLLLWIDEYKGQLTVQELNRLCDGAAKVNVKGGSAVLRPDVVIIVVSNFTIKDCYSKCDDVLMQTLYNRFEEKTTDDFDINSLLLKP